MYIAIALISSFINLVCAYTVEPLPIEKGTLPYSLYYDAESQSLYYCEVFDAQHTLNRFDFNENKHYSAAIEGNNTKSYIIVPVEGQNDQFVINNEGSVEIVEWNGKDSVAKFVQHTFDIENENYIFDSAKASPNHTFYGGTFPLDVCGNSDSQAALYRYSEESGAEAIENNLIVSGHFDWNVEAKKFYFLEMCTSTLYEYDWNQETEEISNRRVVFNFETNTKTADTPSDPLAFSLTIDTEGFLYVGFLYGSAVWKIDPKTSHVVEIIDIPADNTLSLVFGGEDTLFVSTASTVYNAIHGGLIGEIFSPQSGLIFRVDGLNANGYPGRKVQNILHN